MTIDQHKDIKQGPQGHRRSVAPLTTRLVAAWVGSALMLVLVLVGAAAPAAHAAGFIPVSICRTADGQPAISPDVRFNISDPGGISADVAEDRCAPGGALELSMGAGSAHEGSLSLSIDGPGTYPNDRNANFFNVVMWRSIVLDPARDSNISSNPQVGYQMQSGMFAPYGYESCAAPLCTSRGSETAAPLSDTNRYALSAEGNDGHGYVQANVGCAIGNPDYESADYYLPCPATNGPRIRARIYRIAFNAADPTAPVFNGPPAGPLANSGATVKGTQTITYSAGDPSTSRSGAGGVWKAEILVDGQSQATQIADANGGVCKQLADGSFASATPCKSAVANATVSLDTLRFPNGTHTVAVRLTDAASNITTSSPSTVTIANPATNTAKPTLVATGSGSVTAPKQGDTLGSTLGGWAPDGVELKRQWLRCDEQGNACEPIAGATGETYKLAAQDVGQTFRVRVDASNAVGSSSAQSAPSGVAAAPPGGGGGGGAPTGPTSPSGDFDNDGISNNTDQDDDNDGTPDARDPAPYDASIPAATRDEGVIPGSAPGSDGGPGAASKSPGGLNGAYAQAGARLTAAFAKRRGTTGISRFGQSAVLRGHLTTRSGQPITGARLDLRYLTGMGKTSEMSGTTTRVDGGWSLKLPSNIGSRRLIVRYRFDAGRPEADVEQTLALQVQASIGLSVKRSRGRLVFRGRVGIPGTSKAKRQVTIDYRVGRGAWRPFVRARSTRTGSFSMGFRPAGRLAGRVQFRAVVGSGSNVQGGASRVRSVRFSR